MADLKRDETAQLKAESAALREKLAEAVAALQLIVKESKDVYYADSPGIINAVEDVVKPILAKRSNYVALTEKLAEACGTCKGERLIDIAAPDQTDMPGFEIRNCEPCPECAEGDEKV